MEKPEIIQAGALPRWDEEALEASFTVHRMFDAAERTFTGAEKAAFLAAHGPKARAIATRGDSIADREMIEACPNLEIISVYGVGYDGVDVALAKARGVPVTNTPDVLTGDVADIAIAMWLSLKRQMRAAEDWARSGEWARTGAFRLTERAHGQRAGILGLGRIGKAIADRLAGFEMEIAYSGRAAKPVAPDWTFVADPVALARRSDVLFVAAIANEQTRGLVNAEVIEALGPTGAVINISRAQNVDEAALLDALESGRLGGAGLDVFEGEPDLNPRFRALENVVLQPHVGSATVATRKAMGQLMRDNLTRHFAGEALLTPVW